jgi:hypothetical protein
MKLTNALLILVAEMRNDELLEVAIETVVLVDLEAWIEVE